MSLSPELFTKSGKPITIGAGSGTAWKSLKRNNPGVDEHLIDIINKLKYSIEAGYNYLDTAEVYTTQPEVGKAIAASGVSREDLFVATKYSPYLQMIKKTAHTAPDFVDEALAELGTDYLDLLLIHHPFFPEGSTQTIESVWKEIIETQKSGKVRFIGVGSFSADQLKRIIAVSKAENGPLPSVNQIEYLAYLQNQTPGIVEFSHQNNILVQAFGILTPLFRVAKESGLDDHPLVPILDKLSNKYNKSQAQILLRHALQKNIHPLTLSSKLDRIKEAIDIYGFSLSDSEVTEIDTEGAKFHHRSYFVAQFKDS